MLKKVSFTYKGKNFDIDARNCNNFGKFLGLMFTRRKKAEALIFEFKKPVNFRIHSFFVFFPFLAVWLDERNDVIEIRKINSFTPPVAGKKPYKKLLEIPLNGRYQKKYQNSFLSSVIRKI